jgi:hypothetical protein
MTTEKFSKFLMGIVLITRPLQGAVNLPAAVIKKMATSSAKIPMQKQITQLISSRNPI